MLHFPGPQASPTAGTKGNAQRCNRHPSALAADKKKKKKKEGENNT